MLGTGVVTVITYRLVTVEGTAASVVIDLPPVVAVVLGALVVGEPVTGLVAVGTCIVLASVAMVPRAPARTG